MENIKVGDKVHLKERFFIGERSDYTLLITLKSSLQTIKVTRFLSGIGEKLPNFSWVVPSHPAILSDDFQISGKYYIGDNVYMSKLRSHEDIEEDFDSLCEHLAGQEDSSLPGSLVAGYVIEIIAEYNSNPKVIGDFEFFENTKEAEHDFYADNIMLLVQDEGSQVEYLINYKYVTKCD